MHITKMHALGNSYIYISEWESPLEGTDLAQFAQVVSDVRRGVGSDGLILIGRSQTADVRMRIWNADGSEAETCGNGLRCVAKYAYEHRYVTSREFTIETRAGVVRAWVHPGSDGTVERVTIDMGQPRFGARAVGYRGPLAEDDDALAVIDVDGRIYRGSLVSMGNPHCVLFVDDAAAVDVGGIGPRIEHHPSFPDRVNVEFVTPRGRRNLDFRVWERGSGITFACGTGACAAVAAGVRKGLLDQHVTVHLPGGDLDIEVRDDRIWMTGEAVEVFSGELRWPR